MEMAELEKLRTEDARFNERWKKRGGLLTAYLCDHCKELIETRQPADRDVGSQGCWSSIKTCTNCGELNFVRVYPTGVAVSN